MGCRLPRALRFSLLLLLLLTLFLPLAACDAGSASGRAGSSVAPSGTPPAAARSPRIPSAPDLPGWSHSVGFAADGSGFALLARCDDARCEQRVAVLDKGAARWRLAASPLPDVTGDRGITAGLTVLGPGRAVVVDVGEHWLRPAPTWFTRDNGRTWKRGSTEPTGRTATVPEGALLTDECLEPEPDLNSCARNRLLAVLPGTGEHRVLERQPPLKGVLVPAGDVSGTALFVSGTDASGRPALARSTDRGRTWEVARFDYSAAGGGSPRVVAGPDRLYAAQTGQLPEEEGVKNGLRAIHTSRDGGRTWQRVWAYRPGVEPLSLLGDLVATADGGVTVHGERGVWHSTDGARTFRSDGTDRTPAGSVAHTPLGWLWSRSYTHGRYRISADGAHWQGFGLGERGQ